MPGTAARKKTLTEMVAEQGVLAWGQNIPKGRKAPVTFDAMRKVKFLEAFAKCGRLYESARKAGVAYMTAKRHMEADKEFADLVDLARDVYNDSLESECERRAVRGVTEPIFGTVYVDVPRVDGQGTKRVKEHKRVGTKRKYSDGLLQFMMKKHIPEYRDQLDVNAKVQGVFVNGSIPDVTSEGDWLGESEGDRGQAIEVDYNEVSGNDVKRG